MRMLIVLSVSLIFVMNCHAQDSRTVIAGVHEDGSMKLEVPEQNLISAIMKAKSDDHTITGAFVSEGEVPYLIGEADGFVIAYECQLENDKVYINPEGITHSCTAQKCNECAFL